MSYMKKLNDFQDNWNVSYMKNFQDNWKVRYMKPTEEFPGQLERLLHEGRRSHDAFMKAQGLEDDYETSYMKDFQDNWNVSYMKAQKDFQDNWNTSYHEETSRTRWNTSYMKTVKDFQDNWNTSYMK